MTTKLLYLIILSTIGFSLCGQTISLRMCHDSVDKHFPLNAQLPKLEAIKQLDLKNLSAQYLPTLQFNAKFTYQSDVVEFPDLPLPGIAFPEMRKDQYATSIDVSQVLFDGGVVKAVKTLSSEQTEAEYTKVAVDMYKIKEQVNTLYLNILLIQEQNKILQITKETIVERRKVLASAVQNGIAQSSDLDNLSAEIIQLEQQLLELTSKKEQLLNALSILTHINLPDSCEMELPTPGKQETFTYNRPEHTLFSIQSAMLDANNTVLIRKRMPKIAAFGSFGLGNPGMNMFNTEWDTYFLAGVQLSWNIWDRNISKRERQKLEIRKEIINDNKAAFDSQLDVRADEAQIRIKTIKALIEKDKEILALRTQISERSALQLDNGTKTATEYLLDLNAEKRAAINIQTREIQLIQAEIEQYTISGTPLFGDK